jgi:hypothetical protein
VNQPERPPYDSPESVRAREQAVIEREERDSRTRTNALKAVATMALGIFGGMPLLQHLLLHGGQRSDAIRGGVCIALVLGGLWLWRVRHRA